MKYTLVSAMTAIALATAATTGAAGGPVWQGDMFLNTATPTQCNQGGAYAGDSVQAIFAPMGPGNNPKQDQLAVFFPRGSAHLIEPTSGGALNNASSVTVVSITRKAMQKTDQNQNLSPIKISPPAPSAGTASVSISLKVPNFTNVTGCTVTFSGILTPPPGNLGD